jgi:histidinol dehydrogenase
MDSSQLYKPVRAILDEVKAQGDQALFDFTERFDKVKLDQLAVSQAEIDEAVKLVPEALQQAIQQAKANISAFHQSQREPIQRIESMPGVVCWRKSIPISKVGLYIPGGSAPLFSTLLMLGVPAVLAGCQEIVLCTPPQKDGSVHPAILYTAQLMGLTSIYKLGGAQAIGALAYGTESIPQVDKILGPGNAWVTAAKQLVQMGGVNIDLPAGPSELLVVTDATCEPAFVAADLLSQAEHGPDSQVILLTDDEGTIQAIVAEVEKQVRFLPRKDIAREALKHSKAILLKDMEEAMAFSNAYAPEHLILATENAEMLADKVENAGSVFLGHYSPESAGDYASGTNHTLPTNGYARAYSGVSLDTFMKKVTFQQISKQGLQNIGPTVEIMAEAEELFAHKNAVSLRLQKLS